MKPCSTAFFIRLRHSAWGLLAYAKGLLAYARGLLGRDVKHGLKTVFFPAQRTIPCWLLALGPLLVLLAASLAIWGDGQRCYIFWKSWQHAHPTMSQAVKLITEWGNPLAYPIYLLILVHAVRQKKRNDLRLVLCYVVAQLAIAVVLTHLLKNAFGLPRPYTGETAAMPWSFKSMYQSFPSGHTTEIVGAVLPLAVWRQRLSDAALGGLWIAAVAYSRVYLGRHYLMDLWGGLALGCCTALLILYCARKHP